MPDKKVVMDFDRDKAVEKIGSQFDLVLIAAQRARSLKRGTPAKIETGHREGLTALIEIQEGLYTMEDYKTKLAGKKTKDEIEEEKRELELQKDNNDQSF